MITQMLHEMSSRSSQEFLYSNVDSEQSHSLDIVCDSYQVDSAVDEEYPKGTVFSSFLNITNTILGTGMLAMSLAISNVGLLLGIILICCAAGASAFGLYLLAQSANILGTRKCSFFALSSHTMPLIAPIFDSAIAIKCFGVSISYLVVFGSLMPKVTQGFLGDTESIFSSKSTWITIAIILIAPVSFAKELNSLRHTSMLALSAVAYLLFVVVWYFISPVASMPLRIPLQDIELFKVDWSIFTSLPIFVFSFTCHQNIFAVYNELEDNSSVQVNRVIKRSIGVSLAVYLAIGVLGFLTFSGHLGSNLIALYPPGPLITGGQLAIAVLVLLSYPLQCHPCRSSIDKILSTITESPPNSHFTVITLVLLVLSYTLAVFVNDLSTVLALVGGTGSTMICYVLPGILYRKLVDKMQVQYNHAVYRAAALLFWFGIVFMITSLFMQLTGVAGGVH